MQRGSYITKRGAFNDLSSDKTHGTNAITQTRGLGIFTGGYNFNMTARKGTVIRKFTYKVG
jgi:hypothetical protein